MQRPSLLCVMGMLLALMLPVGALSLVEGFASGWVAGTPLSRLSRAADQLEAPELGEDLVETASGVMGAWPKYYLAFGAWGGRCLHLPGQGTLGTSTERSRLRLPRLAEG